MAKEKILIGNIKGPQGEKGDPGVQGEQGEPGEKGADGQRGSRWSTGIAVTGTSTEDMIFNETGISDSVIGDYYLNTETGNIYRCTTAGDADTATWVWDSKINVSGSSGNIDVTFEYPKLEAAGTNVGITIISMSYGSGVFVGVDDASGGIYYSTDLVTWTIGSGISGTMYAVIFANNMFISGGADADGKTSVYYSTDGITWTAGNGVDSNYGRIAGIIYVNDKFIAVGGGIIHSSTDGITWESNADSGITSANAIAYGNGKYVTVGVGGATYYSEDAITWTAGSGASKTLVSVTYGNDKFVAVGYSGTICYSTDGITWVEANSGISSTIKRVIYSDGRFVAVSAGGNILYSSDGVIWKESSRGTDYPIYDIIFIEEDSVYYISGTYIQSLYFIKNTKALEDAIGELYEADSNESTDETEDNEPDEITVDIQTKELGEWIAGSGTVDTSTYMHDITYGNDKFVAVGSSGVTCYSEDGITWTKSGALDICYGVTYGTDKFVAVGSNGATYYSEDGITWTAGGTTGTDRLDNVTYGNGKFVAVGPGSSYTPITYYSEDGITWTKGTDINGNYPLWSVTYGNGKFVAVGAYITYYSEDGITWTAGSGTSSAILQSVTYANGKFVAVGSSETADISNGATYYSEDGVTWTVGSEVNGIPLYGIIYANSKFVTVGASGATYYSEDGIAWTDSDVTGSATLRGVTYGNDKFVAVGDAGAIYYIEFVKETKDLDDTVNDIYGSLIASDGSKFRYGVTEDGKPGYIVTDSEGADSVIPFTRKYAMGDITTNTSTATEVDVGFKPSLVILIFSHNSTDTMAAAFTEDSVSRWYTTGYAVDFISWIGHVVQITDNGFWFKAPNSSYAKKTRYYAIP